MIYKQMGIGRWVTHLGFERGNAIVEAQQIVRGRPWSGWSRMVVQQLPQMPAPSINFIATPHEWVSGRGEPGATVKVHVHGVVIRDVGVDGAGNWATHIGMQPAGRRIEAQQYRVGRPWSGWVGTNVVPVQIGVPTVNNVPVGTIRYRRSGSGRYSTDDERREFILTNISGRGEPGAQVLVHMPGRHMQWVGVDGAGNWSLGVNIRYSEWDLTEIQVYQAKAGYNNSATAVYYVRGVYPQLVRIQ